MNVAGRTVLITGATGGLGHAIARRLAVAGAHVVLSGRRAEVLSELAGEIGGEVAPADLSDPDAVRALAQAHAGIDILVANAGVPASGRLQTYSDDQIERALLVNLHAPIILSQLLRDLLDGGTFGHAVGAKCEKGREASERDQQARASDGEDAD